MFKSFGYLKNPQIENIDFPILRGHNDHLIDIIQNHISIIATVNPLSSQESDVTNCPINQNEYYCITFLLSIKKIRFNFEQPTKFNIHEFGLKRGLTHYT